MIRSSACLAADDVSIRCRVRRSPFATNPQFGEAREMTCTMRNWHPHHYSKQNSSNSIMDGSGGEGSGGSNSSSNKGNNNNNSNNCHHHRRSHSQGQNKHHGMPPPYLNKREQRNHSGASNPQSKTIRAIHGDSHHTGPELLMTPIQDILTNRDASPIRRINQRPRAASVGRAAGRRRSKSDDHMAAAADEAKKKLDNSGMDHSYHHPQQYHYHDTADNTVDANASFSIPLQDIVFVEAKSSAAQQHNNPHQRSSSRSRSSRRNSSRDNKSHHCLLLTTMENGYLEFCCATSNGHDVLHAFLQASIPPERMVNNDDDSRSIPSAASSSMSACMDVDRLTTQQIKVSQETWPQRFQRRVGKVVHTISEVSETLCDYANCCREAETTAGSPMSESRDMPPPTPPSSSSVPSSTRSTHHKSGIAVPFFGNLEMVDDDVASFQAYYHSSTTTRSSRNYYNNAEKDKHAAGSFSRKSCRLPSGLSVEPDPALETMYHANY